MVEDYVLLVSASVIVAAVMILGSFLFRYKRLVDEASKSTRLAKDVWDSMNSRFTIIDTRIIDLLARTEVLSAKLLGTQSQKAPVVVVSAIPTSVSNVLARSVESPKSVATSTRIVVGEVTETEARVLQFLLEGPRTSAQIKENVGRSREHTARLMKFLFDKGLVVRNSQNKPYVYRLTESGKSYLDNWSTNK